MTFDRTCVPGRGSETSETPPQKRARCFGLFQLRGGLFRLNGRVYIVPVAPAGAPPVNTETPPGAPPTPPMRHLGVGG